MTVKAGVIRCEKWRLDEFEGRCKVTATIALGKVTDAVQESDQKAGKA